MVDTVPMSLIETRALGEDVTAHLAHMQSSVGCMMVYMSSELGESCPAAQTSGSAVHNHMRIHDSCCKGAKNTSVRLHLGI